MNRRRAQAMRRVIMRRQRGGIIAQPRSSSGAPVSPRAQKAEKAQKA
jgi:hypothetical protein